MAVVCPSCGNQEEVRFNEELGAFFCGACKQSVLLNDQNSLPQTDNHGNPLTVADQANPPEEQSSNAIAGGHNLEDAGAPVARLIHVDENGHESEYKFGNTATIGRHPDNTIRLQDREISKLHARIERRGVHWFIHDLKSSNGTYVNNRKVDDLRLVDGDELLLGAMRLVFRVPDEDRAQQLVTILPKDPNSTTHIHAKIRDVDPDFRPAEQVTDMEVLRRDYEKLRLSHELSRIGLATDIGDLLKRTLEVVFGMFPADNAVIMLLDEETEELVPHTVKQKHPGDLRAGILLSRTILDSVVRERASVLSSDAFLDPRFSGAVSVISQGIRAAMCVPMIGTKGVLGVMHLDSRERVGIFKAKDLQILKAIANQTAVAIENVRLIEQVEREAQTRVQLSRFLPMHVVDEMVRGKGAPIRKGGREVEASVVYCDIRGFTSISETIGPQNVVNLLNDFFERLVDIVFGHDGVLDKFIGDSLMATWGSLESDDDLTVSTYKAVAAAIEFRDAVRKMNAERQENGELLVPMGVGVNTGRMVAGYMGSKRRLEFTVIGDTVNTASRICGIAKGDQVLISEATHRYVADRVDARYLGTRRVKGKEQEVGIFEVLSLK